MLYLIVLERQDTILSVTRYLWRMVPEDISLSIIMIRLLDSNVVYLLASCFVAFFSAAPHNLHELSVSPNALRR